MSEGDPLPEEVVLVLGYPASGKSSLTFELFFPGYARLNRDELGGSLSKLAAIFENKIKGGSKSFVLDNTFPTRESRAPFIKIAKKNGLITRCIWVTTSLEDAQFNAVQRMVRKYKKLLDSKESKKIKDDNCFPIVTLYAYKKAFETPTTEEGFDSVERVSFSRKFPEDYVNKALILDYDGTLRITKNGDKYPIHPDNISILPKRKETLDKYVKQGYILAGISNQSGIGSGELTSEDAISCFEKTNTLLEHKIDYNFCPHKAFPLECFCRKPHVGNGVLLIEKYKLNPSECIMVGDMTTDKTFAARCGFQYVPAEKFFK